jgi:hypothetical protein
VFWAVGCGISGSGFLGLDFWYLGLQSPTFTDCFQRLSRLFFLFLRVRNQRIAEIQNRRENSSPKLASLQLVKGTDGQSIEHI